MKSRRYAMLMTYIQSIPYKIFYELNGGTLPTTAPTSYSIATSDFILEQPIKTGYEFLGWTLNKDDKTFVTKSNFGDFGDKTYTAYWKMNISDEDISNNLIDLSIGIGEDSNNDNIPDNYIISFIGSSNMEKVNLTLTNLLPNQKYILSFTESNNAIPGSYHKGYKSSMYGCFINNSKDIGLSSPNKEVSRGQNGLISEWIGDENGSMVTIDGLPFQGPRDMSLAFTASNPTMYWVWDYGGVQDEVKYTYNLNNILLTPINPSIQFDKMALKDTAPMASFTIKSYDEKNLTFSYSFNGESGTEILYYPITGLAKNATYTITFKHTYQGNFINGDGGSYDYGCGIIDDIANAKLASKLSGISSSWLSNTWTMNTVSNSTETVSLTFVAPGDTVYWVWNMANVSDGTIANIDLSITELTGANGNNKIIFI